MSTAADLSLAAQITRLQELVEEAYKEGFEAGGEAMSARLFLDENDGWSESDAKLELEKVIHPHQKILEGDSS